MDRREVVVTGIGGISSLGASVDEMWSALLEGRSGIRSIPRNSSLSGYGVHLLALSEAPVLYDKHHSDWNISKKLERNMSSVTKMLCHAAFDALKNSNIGDYETLRSYDDAGVVIGAGVSLCDHVSDVPLEERNAKWFLDSYPNIHLANLSMATGLKGYGSTIVNACTSSSQAIGQAYKTIRYGESEIMLAGGCDGRTSHSFLSGFSRLNMHTSGEDSETAMRPFDRDRDGFVLGTGASMLVLESAEHAAKRGAEPLAKVVGFGSSLDSYRLTDPCPQGKAKAIELAIKDAGINYEQVDYVNAHGTSTQLNDKAEVQAISYAFPSCRPWVNSTKSMIGHTLAASGALESIACIQSLREQKLHPNLNLENPDHECTLNFVGKRAISVDIKFCINNSSGIGGSNTSLVFQRA